MIIKSLSRAVVLNKHQRLIVSNRTGLSDSLNNAPTLSFPPTPLLLPLAGGPGFRLCPRVAPSPTGRWCTAPGGKGRCGWCVSVPASPGALAAAPGPEAAPPGLAAPLPAPAGAQWSLSAWVVGWGTCMGEALRGQDSPPHCSIGGLWDRGQVGNLEPCCLVLRSGGNSKYPPFSQPPRLS